MKNWIPAALLAFVLLYSLTALGEEIFCPSPIILDFGDSPAVTSLNFTFRNCSSVVSDFVFSWPQRSGHPNFIDSIDPSSTVVALAPGASRTLTVNIFREAAQDPGEHLNWIRVYTDSYSECEYGCEYEVRMTVLDECSTGSIFQESKHFTAEGGDGTVEVRMEDGCSWEASENATWIDIYPDHDSGSGTDNVIYHVSENSTTEARSAIIYIEDFEHTVTQAASEEEEEEPEDGAGDEQEVIVVEVAVEAADPIEPSYLASNGQRSATITILPTENELADIQAKIAQGIALTLEQGLKYANWMSTTLEYLYNVWANAFGLTPSSLDQSKDFDPISFPNLQASSMPVLDAICAYDRATYGGLWPTAKVVEGACYEVKFTTEGRGFFAVTTTGIRADYALPATSLCNTDPLVSSYQGGDTWVCNVHIPEMGENYDASRRLIIRYCYGGPQVSGRVMGDLTIRRVSCEEAGCDPAP